MKVDAGCFVSALGMIRHDLMVESESNNVSKDEKHCRGIGTAGEISKVLSMECSEGLDWAKWFRNVETAYCPHHACVMIHPCL